VQGCHGALDDQPARRTVRPFLAGIADAEHHAARSGPDGGLFNFLSGSRVRTPLWIQHAGLEWARRIWLEPRRLLWRYLTTNPRALYMLLNRGRSTDIGGTHNR
jgi:UDP-N-acetyl-D-mannosaminuronic acid transferase (WecB/TagA/CpsF family)